MKHIVGIYLLLLLLTAGFSSCMREDFSDCDDQLPLVALRFVYTHHDHTEELTDLFSDYVNDVSVYIFDKDGNYIHHVDTLQSLLSDGHTLYLNLEEGEYNIVTWANLFSDSYTINDTGKLSRSNYHIEVKESHHQVDDLFYGTTLLSVESTGGTKEISLTCNTHLVRIKLLGLPEPSRTIEGTEYSVRIEGSNTLYDFDNNAADGTATTYMPGYTGLYEEGEYIMQAEFMIQRLFRGDDLTLKLLQETYIRKEEALTERIVEAYKEIETNEDLDRKYIYELYYELTPAGFVFIGTSLKDWKGTPMPGDL